MQAGREFVLFASVAVTLFGLVASSGVIIYGAAKLPKDVLNSIEETRKAMGCNAHVLPTVAGQGASPKCESFYVTIKPQIPLNTANFRTKVCSAPDEISFPFNGSSFFDMGMALRKSLKDNPIPRNAAVLRNPKCCHATKATSRNFAKIDKLTIRVVKLANVEITECGCGTV
ncbi:Hypothetical predicted protein [Paramuricea clavata]|uniref:Uncharacterized protein n=1 Tax=Paramuricea clavata TaxID=317549 RepID=A0A6S7K582_PARCT|nr:Hypothetical predicted protein [Paramuricea clavata]